MFKDRAVQMKFVKTKDEENETEIPNVMHVDPAEIAQIITEYTLKTVGTIGAVIAANKVLKTICEIAVISAQAKVK